MPEQLTITCPHCAFSKDVSKSAIPEGARQVTCPKCKQAFPLNDENMRSLSAQVTPSATTEASPPSSAPPSQPPVPAQPASEAIPRTLAFVFHGTARDYFGIWVVNTLLKLVTVGIYSAWAKVRKRCFFYGSTTLQGQPFEYLANPITLFKGWLIAAAAFILYSLGTRISPILSGTIALIVFFAFPWLVVRSRIFNAVNSSYRNIRFGFLPDYQQAYLVYAALPFCTLLSLGLLSPYTLYRQKKFMVENSRYGATPFSFDATVKDFYLLFLKIGLGFLAIVGLIAILMGMTGSNLVSSLSTGGGLKNLPGLAIIPVVALPLVYFIMIVYAQTAITNLSWNATRLASGSFRSTLRTRDMVLLFLTNALAIMCSLGMLMPWATIRLARYRFEHLELETLGGLDDVLAAAGSSAVSATGDEIGDVFDMQLDIAL